MKYREIQLELVLSLDIGWVVRRG